MTTISYSRRSQDAPHTTSQNAMVILISWSVLYIRLLLVTFIVAPTFQQIRVPLLIMFLASILPTVVFWEKRFSVATKMPKQSNPTELRSAVTFGLLYALILFVIAFAKKYFTHSGFLAVSALSGLADMDAIALTISRLVNLESLRPEDSLSALIVALLANIAFRGLMTVTLGGLELTKAIFLPWMLSMFSGVLLLFLW